MPCGCRIGFARAGTPPRIVSWSAAAQLPATQSAGRAKSSDVHAPVRLAVRRRHGPSATFGISAESSFRGRHRYLWGGLTLHSGPGGHCRPAVGRVVLAPFWLVDLGTLAAVEPPLLCPFWNYRTSVATSPCPGSPGSAGTSAGSWGAGPLARPRGDRGAGTPCRAEQVGDLVVAVDARDCAARPARLAPGHASTASSDTPATRRLLTRSRVPESSGGRRPDRDRSCPGTGQRRRDVQYWRFRGPPCRIP